MDYMFLIVIIVVMFGMMFWQSKKAKQQQAERQDFRANLQPGTEVITIGGVIGKVVSVDTEYEEIVIGFRRLSDSFRFQRHQPRIRASCVRTRR